MKGNFNKLTLGPTCIESDIDMFLKMGYHGWAGKYYTTIIPVALSGIIISKDFSMSVNRGKESRNTSVQVTVKASTAQATGSFFHDTSRGYLAMHMLANKSTTGSPKLSTIFRNDL